MWGAAATRFGAGVQGGRRKGGGQPSSRPLAWPADAPTQRGPCENPPRRGRFVVVASMAAKVPSPGQASYSAAKAALWGYFASLAAEVADQ